MSNGGSQHFTFLPPLLPPGGNAALAASIITGNRGARDTPPKVKRQSGGKETTFTSKDLLGKLPVKPTLNPTAKGRALAQQRNADQSGRLLPQQALDAQPLTAKDLDAGVMSLLERGLIPPSLDLSAAIAGPSGGIGLMSVSAAPLHKHVEQFRRQEILTADQGFGAVMNVKLDAKAIAAMDPNPPPPPAPKPLVVVPPAEPVAPAPPPPPAQDSKQREDTRTYAELLDMYSLHEFIIRKGTTLRNTPEFISYQRSYAAHWGAISVVISHLEALLSQYGVPVAYVDGRKVHQLAAVDMGTPSKEELLACIANRTDVDPHVVSVVQQFKQGQKGHHAAATKIQSVMRMYLQRKRYKHLVKATLVAIMIQRLWAIHRGHMKTRKTLAVQRDALLAKWRQIQAQFVVDWPRISNSRRVIVHVPSIPCSRQQARTTPFFAQMQRAQLPRICDLTDDKVEIVLITPLKIENEALQYYYSMLQANGVRSPESRVILLTPEIIDRLQDGYTLPLAKTVLASSRLMRVLQSILRGKVAYMVPGLVGVDEQMLAARLGIPMLAPEAKVAAAFFTKSGAKTVLESGDAVTPIGAHNIRTVPDLFGALARLIAEYPEHSKWLIKLDTEFSSRGHAVLDRKKLRSLESDDIENEDPAVIAAAVLQDFHDGAAKRIKMLNTRAYPEWEDYAKAITVGGCCVEAIPSDLIGSVSTNVLIEPDGTAKLLSVQQQVHFPAYTHCGVRHPQSIAHFEALRDASMSIAASAYRKKIIGYVTIDFVAFRRADTQAPRLWAVDMELRLTNNALAHSLAMLASGATYDHVSGQAVVKGATNNGEAVALHYAYSGIMYHPYISALRHSVFFNLCRQRNLIYDVHSKTGVVFHLIDTLLCNCLGALCISHSARQCATLLLDVVDFVHQQLIAAQAVSEEGTNNVTSLLTAARNMAQNKTTDRKKLLTSATPGAGTTPEAFHTTAGTTLNATATKRRS